MKKILLLLTVFCVVSSQAKNFVAVLETMSQIISYEEKIFVTDKIRGEASYVLPKKDFAVMTRENIVQMLPPGKSIEECEGSCLVETGKNISADYVCQGRVTQVGSKLALTIELYSTRDAELLSTINMRAENIDDMLNELEQILPNFFKPLLEKNNEIRDSLVETAGTIDSVIQIEIAADSNGVVEQVEAFADTDGVAEQSVTVADSAVALDSAEVDSAKKDANVVMDIIAEKADTTGVEKPVDSLPTKPVDSTVGSTRNIFFGIYASATYNDVYGMSLKFKNVETKTYSVKISGDDELMGNFWGVGFNGGLGLLYNLNSMFGLHLELGVAYRHAAGDSEVSAELEWDDASKAPEKGGFGLSMEFTQFRLDIPVMVRLRVNPIYFELGVLSSVCFTSSFESTVEYDDEESSYEKKGFADVFETGLIVGLGSSRKIGVGTLDFSLRFAWGLLPLGEFAGNEPKTLQGQLNVTYWFM